jgi:monocyte to macrophage differentiation protein
MCFLFFIYLFQIEHIANVITHGFWVIPSLYACYELLVRSSSIEQKMAALIYGGALSSLFAVSTIFHCVFYCNDHR